MSKFTKEEKIRAVREYLEGKQGYKTIANKIGVNNAVFHNWIKQYQLHGEETFNKLCTADTLQYKIDVLNYMNGQGTSIRETAAIFNIPSPSTILQWKKQLETEGLDALEPKKKGRSKQGKITKQDKAKVVYELRLKFPVISLLQLAGIPRSTYYYLVGNFDRPDPDAELKVLIKIIYDENEGRYGYRRIRDELVNQGQKVNHKKVQRIMKGLGLKSLVRMKKYRTYKGTVGNIAPNILERNFKAEKPNEKWVTDITEFKLFGEKLYLSPMLDLYNGEIITYTIGSRPVYTLVSTMLDQAFERLTDKEELLIHSDQGWHYQMKQYCHTLEERGITQSMSRKGNCYDNAVIENFFGIMKSEFLYLKEFESLEHFKQELEKYINYYNNKRIKAKLKGMSPVKFRIHAQQAA